MPTLHELVRRIEELELQIRLDRDRVLRLASSTGGQSCPLVWEFTIDGNPSSGLQEWDITINGDTQTIEFDWDEDAAALDAKLIAAFTALSSGDVTVSGGDFPDIAIYVTWKSGLKPDYPPVQGTTTLNNSAHCKVRKNSVS